MKMKTNKIQRTERVNNTKKENMWERNRGTRTRSYRKYTLLMLLKMSSSTEHWKRFQHVFRTIFILLLLLPFLLLLLLLSIFASIFIPFIACLVLLFLVSISRFLSPFLCVSPLPPLSLSASPSLSPSLCLVCLYRLLLHSTQCRLASCYFTPSLLALHGLQFYLCLIRIFTFFFVSAIRLAGYFVPTAEKSGLFRYTVHVYKFHTFPNTLTHIFVLVIQFLAKENYIQ